MLSSVAEERGTELDAAASVLGNLPGLQYAYTISLEFFSGPMDLLLHLVSQQEVPIEEVQMSVVAEQYLEIVSSQANSLDLERATEYLVIAATLLAIKSRSLLPSENLDDEEVVDVEGFDSRFFEDLRARLQAYKTTRSRAEALQKAPQLGFDTFTRIDRKALQPTPEMMAEPENADKLGGLFYRLLKRIGEAGSTLRIALEPVSVVSYMMKFVDLLSDRRQGADGNPSEDSPRSFFSLIRNFVAPGFLSKLAKEDTRDDSLKEARGVVIGSFVAVLELVKRGLMSVEQDDLSGEISVSLKMNAGVQDLSLEQLSSEFDGSKAEAESQAGTEIEEERTGKVVHMSDYLAAAKDQEAGQEIAALSEEEDDEQRTELKEVGSV